MTALDAEAIKKLYLDEKLSVQAIADRLGCSGHRVIYWMDKYGVKRRTIGEAIYILKNPDGDPFYLRTVKTFGDAQLLGLGLGLYWGEGTKSNTHSVRLGNTDPALINVFIRFLVELCGVQKEDLRFGLQLFTDIDPKTALSYWLKQLGAQDSQFYKITVTISGSIGTYRKKSQYGVVTLYYHNKKLRDILVGMLPR